MDFNPSTRATPSETDKTFPTSFISFLSSKVETVSEKTSAIFVTSTALATRFLFSC